MGWGLFRGVSRGRSLRRFRAILRFKVGKARRLGDVRTLLSETVSPFGGSPRHRSGDPGWKRVGGLTIQALHGQDVVPAEQRVAAQPLIVGRHERARRGRVCQAERVADLVRQDHEQVAPAPAAQGPALVPVEVRFAAAGQEGVRQGAPCRQRKASGGRHPPRTPRSHKSGVKKPVSSWCVEW